MAQSLHGGVAAQSSSSHGPVDRQAVADGLPGTKGRVRGQTALQLFRARVIKRDKEAGVHRNPCDAFYWQDIKQEFEALCVVERALLKSQSAASFVEARSNRALRKGLQGVAAIADQSESTLAVPLSGDDCEVWRDLVPTSVDIDDVCGRREVVPASSSDDTQVIGLTSLSNQIARGSLWR